MPELPEVETVRRGLEPALAGKRIVRVETRRADLRFPWPERFAARVEGQRVERVWRRAKYLIAELASGESLIAHLGMTGRFTIVRDGVEETPGAYVYENGGDPKHDHAVLHVEDGTRIVYNDPRRFGFMDMAERDGLEQHKLIKAIGVEPLGNDWNAAYLAMRSAGKSVNLKALLMDQRIVAGLGNIYVSEALHRAGLSPNRKASSLSDVKGRPTARAERLVPAVRQVLEAAILAGGSTLRDYRHADGTMGHFQNAMQVYDRDGDACLRAGCGGVVRLVVHAGRSSYYCGRCQR